MDMYIRKPSIYKAVQLSMENIDDVVKEFETTAYSKGSEKPEENWIHVVTWIGPMLADIGDWIIKDAVGDVRVLSDESFHKLYRKATNEESEAAKEWGYSVDD